MTQETTGIDRCEELINQLLTAFLDGEPVLNERAPSARPQNRPYTGFMIFWSEGHAHVFKSFMFVEDERRMVQAIEDDAYLTARIICYGKNSMKRVMAIRSFLNSDLSAMQQFRQEMGVCDIDDAQSIPEPDVNGTIRERAYINFKFYARVVHQFDVDHFDRVTVITSVPDLSFTKTDVVESEV